MFPVLKPEARNSVQVSHKCGKKPITSTITSVSRICIPERLEPATCVGTQFQAFWCRTWASASHLLVQKSSPLSPCTPWKKEFRLPKLLNTYSALISSHSLPLVDYLNCIWAFELNSSLTDWLTLIWMHYLFSLESLVDKEVHSSPESQKILNAYVCFLCNTENNYWSILYTGYIFNESSKQNWILCSMSNSRK